MDSGTWTPGLAALAGALVGSFVGLTGVGGGALMTPILLLGFGVDPVVAIATDLFFAAITKIAAAAVHFRGQHIDFLVVRRLWWGSIPACLIVGWTVAGTLDPDVLKVLKTLVGGLVAISALSMLLGPRVQQRRTEARLADPQGFKRWQAAWTVASGALLGAVIAATSIGAGAIGAVLLRALYPLRMTPIRLVATDTAFAIPVALVAGASYAVSGWTSWSLLGWMLVGSIPAAMAASVLAARLNASFLRTAVGAVLLLTAAKMLGISPI